MTLFQRVIIRNAFIFVVFFIATVSLGLLSRTKALNEKYIADVNYYMDVSEISLTGYLEKNDLKKSEDFIHALFQDGLFDTIKITLLSSNEELIHPFRHKFISYPAWLTQHIHFPIIKEKRMISSGWTDIAEIEFISSPSNIYQSLWQQSYTFFMQIAVLCFAMFILSMLLIRPVLSPIRLIAKHAKDILNNRFTAALPQPNDHELKQITLAMNKMSIQLKSNFDEQASEAYRIRENAFRDTISGLANRTYFNNQLSSWISESAHGSLLLIHHHGIAHAYKNRSVEIGEKITKQFASLLSRLASDQILLTARVTDEEFAILIEQTTSEDIQMFATQLVNLCQENSSLSKPESPISIGATINTGEIRETRVLLAQTDSALREAMSLEELLVTRAQISPADNMGKQQWKSLIIDAITHDWVVFKLQAATDQKNRVIHQEVFSAIEHNGKYYGAAKFLAAVEQLELGEHFDRHVITRMIERLTHEKKLRPLSINLTKQSATSATFLRWLSSVLQKNQNLKGRLFFEIPEATFIHYPNHLTLVTEQINRFNFGFGIDNYGRNFKSLGYLSNFSPTYVKIDFSYTCSINNDEQNFVLASICRTAHNLNITTIATRVETEGQLNKLSELFVEGFQGFIFEKQEQKRNALPQAH